MIPEGAMEASKGERHHLTFVEIVGETWKKLHVKANLDVVRTQLCE